MSAMLLLVCAWLRGVVLSARPGGWPARTRPRGAERLCHQRALPALATSRTCYTATRADPRRCSRVPPGVLMLGPAALVFGYGGPTHEARRGDDRRADPDSGARQHVVRRPAMMRPGSAAERARYGIVIDQLGSYLALSTFGLLVAARAMAPADALEGHGAAGVDDVSALIAAWSSRCCCVL